MSRMPALIRIAKIVYGLPFKAFNNIRLKNECNADLKASPYLYIVNHVGVYDPIMVSCVMPRHIRWVAGAYLVKTKFLNLVLGKGCTVIPKQQGQSDLSMIRGMQKALREGDNVGIFPEGTRTWDGEMMPVNYTALAKLVRMFKVPVLFVHLEGGYAWQPRWVEKHRKGRVDVNVKHMLTPEQMKEMDLPSLEETVREYLHFSNDEWKRTADYRYRSAARAEGLQRLFYMCPCCREVGTVSTRKDLVSCTCGASAVVNEMDDLVAQSGNEEHFFGFRTFREWHEWEAASIAGRDSFSSEHGVLFQAGSHDNRVLLDTISEDIQVKLENQAIVVDCEVLSPSAVANSAPSHYEFPLDGISSLVLNARQTMEFVSGGMVYRVRLDPDSSSLKYQEYYLGLKEER